MTIDLKQLSPQEAYNFLASAVVPRPITFVTTENIILQKEFGTEPTDQQMLRPIARMGGNCYAWINDVFRLERYKPGRTE